MNGSKEIIKKLKLCYKYFKIVIIYFNCIRFRKGTSKKEIIIVFDGNFGHGGLVDRLKGMVSFYAISKEIGSDFKIYFKHPFSLETFLKPNKHDWTASKDDLQFNPLKTKFLFLMDDFSFNWVKSIRNSNKQKFIVYANIDYLEKIHQNHKRESLNDKWQFLFNELFCKSLLLEQKIDSLDLSKDFIAIHTRFTSLLGDFNDTSQRFISEKRKGEILSLLKDEIITIDSDLPKIVFSDSILFLNFIKENTNALVLEGTPSHIDVTNSGVEEENLKTFVDFFVISEAKRIYLLRTKEMYNSAFSKYAACIGKADFINKEI